VPFATIENMNPCHTAGMNDFMSKPISIYALFEKVNVLVQDKRKKSGEAANESILRGPTK